MNTSKIVRNISGALVFFICVTLIFLFGIMPLFKLAANPVLGSDKRSLYSKGSLVFVQNIELDKLNTSDTIIYYSRSNLIGAKVITNDKNAKKVLVETNDNATFEIPYIKISGKGVFSVPWFGSYANWLTNGAGLTVSVITMGVIFVIFTVSAIATRED